MTLATRAFAVEIDAALDRLDVAALEREYWAQDEFLFIPRFLPPVAVGALLDDVRRLEPGLNRNYVPRHKKGGSVSHYPIADEGPALLACYHSERFRRYHGVSPVQEGERRVVYTMECVTSQEMGRVQRLYCNLKDAVAYFGIRALLRGRGRTRAGQTRVNSES
jgi:hypothetical protein